MAICKTSELIDQTLDFAVSIALGHRPEKDFHSHGMTWNGWWETAAYIDTKPNEYRRLPKYSTDWAAGGPIIEREGISLEVTCMSAGFEWVAKIDLNEGDVMVEEKFGPTPLISAMRCYVASKLGDEVEIPEELAG